MRPCWLYALFKCHNQTFVRQNLPSLCFGNTNAFSWIFKQFGVREDKKKQIITIIVITIIIKLDLMVACVGGACQRDSQIVLEMNG